MRSDRFHILCVDSNPDSCELIRMMAKFEGNDYRFTDVENAYEALDLINKQVFDLYIMDYRLPGLAGTDLCRLIRQRDKETPVLFFTGMARSIDREEAMSVGATAYLVKPNDLDKLIDTIRKLLNDEKAHRNQDMVNEL